MKLVLFLFLTCGAFAQAVASERYPAGYFSSKEEAIASVEKSFAGGSYQELEVAQKKVLVLYHYASGVFSTDAAVYVFSDKSKAWHLVAYYAPLFNSDIHASVEGSQVSLCSKEAKQVLLTVTIASDVAAQPMRKARMRR